MTFIAPEAYQMRPPKKLSLPRTIHEAELKRKTLSKTYIKLNLIKFYFILFLKIVVLNGHSYTQLNNKLSNKVSYFRGIVDNLKFKQSEVATYFKNLN